MENMRVFTKYGAVGKKATLRYFLIEDGQFVEGKPGGCGGGKAIKKKLSLKKAKVTLENMRDLKNGSVKWTNPNDDYRLQITLVAPKKGKKDKEYYVYSNDLDELKGLLVQIKLEADAENTKKINEQVQSVSHINVFQAVDDFWQKMSDHARTLDEKIDMKPSPLVNLKSELKSTFKVGEAVSDVQR